MNNKKKIIRACTVSLAVGFVRGVLPDLKKKYDVVLLSGPGPELDAMAKDYGVRSIEVPMARQISIWQDVKSLFKLIKVFKKEKPYMVHSMTPKAGLLCMFAAKLTRVPVRVHTFTGLVWPTIKGVKKRILMLTDKITCACATHIIPEGKGVKSDLIENGITKKDIKVLGYGNVQGIDVTRFSRRPEVMSLAKNIRKEDLFTFLFVGRIVGDKGINELVASFQKLNTNYPKTRLLLVGWYENDQDPISSETKNIIDNHNMIEAVGEKRGDDLIAYYAAADCFVFPSYREGFPNTVLEAGAMGLPCIVTDINGSREIIKEGENGLIVPSRDEKALYDAMLCMITDTEKRAKMANNARIMIVNRFEKGYVQKCLLDFYDEIITE